MASRSGVRHSASAIETGHSKVIAAGGGTPDLSRYTAIFVKRDGHWLQSFVHEQPETNVSPHEHLKELEWMVGEWVDESEVAVAFTTCVWSEDKNYLLRLFTIVTRGKTVMSGTQRIGWDPLTKQIKSWVFDSDGGHSQGLWSRTGNQWFVHATGVLADGQTSASTQVITLVNKDLARWKSIGRTVGGKAVPDIEEFALVRKPPQPK